MRRVRATADAYERSGRRSGISRGRVHFPDIMIRCSKGPKLRRELATRHHIIRNNTDIQVNSKPPHGGTTDEGCLHRGGRMRRSGYIGDEDG